MPTQRNHILSVVTLLEGWSKTIRIAYTQLRRDGTTEFQERDLLDRGDGVTTLLHNPASQLVLLLRQPRIIATVKNKDDGLTIEACNGLVHDETPLACALREVEEETGHRLTQLTPVAAVYASPGASLEIVHIFLGKYSEATRISHGGGLSAEGEDIELMEVAFDQALRWIDDGTICDARTIIALRHLQMLSQEKAS